MRRKLARMDHDGRERLCRAISAVGNPPPEEECLKSERDVADDGFVVIPRMLHQRRHSFPRSLMSRRGSRGRNAADALARHFHRLELQTKFGVFICANICVMKRCGASKRKVIVYVAEKKIVELTCCAKKKKNERREHNARDKIY